MTSWPIWKNSTKRMTIHQNLSLIQTAICFLMETLTDFGRLILSSVIRSLVKKYSSVTPKAVRTASAAEILRQCP